MLHRTCLTFVTILVSFLGLAACNEPRPVAPAGAAQAAAVAVPAAVPAPAAAPTVSPAAEPACPHAGGPSCPGHAEAAAAPAAEPACQHAAGAGCGAHGDHAAAPAAEAAAAGPALTLTGTSYGAGVTVAEVTAVSKILAAPDTFAGKRVRVEGVVTDVCQKRGCWFEMASDKEFETLQFKVVDGVMVFPMSAKGKYAVAEGTVRKIPLSLEDTRRVLAHRAEEQGQPFDESKVTAPTTLVRIDGLGAVIRDAK